MTFELRKVQPADWEFVWALRVATMKDVIADAYGWDDDVQRSFAAESMAGEVVVVDASSAGVLALARRPHELHLVWMAVVPAMQRQGLGSSLIAHCQRLAREMEQPLTLQVLRNNPAMSLYARHGFERYARNGNHNVLMRWEWRPPGTKSFSPRRRVGI